MATLAGGRLRGPGVFLSGAAGELERLFGVPLPLLPPGEPRPGGGERIAVELPPRLREAAGRWLGAVAAGLAGRGGGPGGAEDAEREYHDRLAAELRAAVLADRREGLENVFWLAHSRELAELVERQFGAPGAAPALRYRAYPILAGLLRRAAEHARAVLPRAERLVVEFRDAGGGGGSLARPIVDDQLALTERDVRAFDAGRTLVPENPRFRLSAAAYLEIDRILRERLERALARGDAALRRALAELGPAGLPGGADGEAGLRRLVHAEPVRELLLADLEGTAAALVRSRILQAERRRAGGWPELLAEWDDLSRCLRRAEAVAELRGALELTVRSHERRDDRERFLEGRLLRFGAADGAVRGSLRTATILFADLRGFTEASGGHLSEGDLVRELYEIFDPAALVVSRFGGRVDKYLGDGLMATFAAGISPGAECVAAVRSAVVIRQVVGRLRRQGRTRFEMGISLHAGRVAVARFLRGEGGVDTTVIGRHMNLAGRLSGSEAGGSADRSVGEVALGSRGGIVNRGIAVSGGLLEILRGLLPLEPFREGGVEGFRCWDQELALWLNFGYVGEARLRGLPATVPVWSLVAAPPGAAAEGA